MQSHVWYIKLFFLIFQRCLYSLWSKQHQCCMRNTSVSMYPTVLLCCRHVSTQNHNCSLLTPTSAKATLYMAQMDVTPSVSPPTVLLSPLPQFFFAEVLLFFAENFAPPLLSEASTTNTHSPFRLLPIF